ncbi:hypothetical protein TR80_007015 [Xanthomonas campestris]|nr:hypothetical protein TR80_007015 [Xanthomonas campestris]
MSPVACPSTRPQLRHACVGARLRAMRRYRESFVARKRAPTRHVFRPEPSTAGLARTHARRSSNHPDRSDITLV